MKKIIMAVAAIAMAASVFAVDFAATTKMEGSIANGTFGLKDKEVLPSVGALTLNKKDQKDNDALILSVNGDKAGAKFQMFYQYEGGEGAGLKLRGTNIWMKPVDWLKITLGDVSEGTYKERLEWWKVPTGSSAKQHNAWDNKWSGFASVEGAGINLNIYPIAGLEVSIGVAPGAGAPLFKTETVKVAKVDDNGEEVLDKDGNPVMEKKPENTYAAWGAFAKYQLLDNLSAAVSYRDAGKGAAKIAAVGADFGNWGTPYYGFLNLRFFFDKMPLGVSTELTDVKGTEENSFQLNDVTLTGIVVDNYITYNMGFAKLDFRFPVTIRGLVNPTINYKGQEKDLYELYNTLGVKATKKDFDPSYMTFAAKVAIPVEAATVYVFILDDEAMTFNSSFADSLQITVKPGVTFNVGACACDIAAQLDFGAGFKSLSWSIPFTATVGF